MVKITNKNIKSHEDKVWVGVGLVPKDKLRFLAADIAELALPIFENAYPDDKRPRLAIEAARKGDEEKARLASYGAIRAGNGIAYAADATYADIEDVAYAAARAAYAAADAAAAYPVSCAFWVALADKTLKKQIRTLMLRYLK